MELDPLAYHRGAELDVVSDAVVGRVAGPGGIELLVEYQLEAGDVLVCPVNLMNGEARRVADAVR